MTDKPKATPLQIPSPNRPVGSVFATIAVLAGCTFLLWQQLTGEVWAWAAHISYGVYLVFVIVAALTLRNHSRRIPVTLTMLWAGLAAMLVIAAYVPSGWMLGNRVLLVALLVLASARLIGIYRERHRAFPLAGLLTVCVALSMTVLLTYIIDRGVGAAIGDHQPGGLIFPRNSTIAYQTPEFSHRVAINRYGFRGPNFDLGANVDCRIMLVGDSFTYGWGVDYEQAWGHLLQTHIDGIGINAQVLNLGAPGANVADYAKITELAAPIFQPDVILVGVLQGDDMRQVSREDATFPRQLTFGDDVQPSGLTEFVSFHYPFIAKRTVLSHVSAASVRSNWEATAGGFIDIYTQHADQMQRYNALPVHVQSWFTDGHISPHMVHFAVTTPDYWAWPLQDPATLTPYINQMAADFAAIAESAPQSEILVLSVPYGAYTQDTARQNLMQLGFILPPEITESALVDDAIEQAADAAGVPFMKVTDTFRTHDGLAFYPVDGHFNAEGNRLFAESIAPPVADYCTE